MIAISSNDVGYVAEDSPERLKAMVAEEGFVFPLCYDETQEVAIQFDAACTPDIFLFDKDRKLAYRGQLDGSRPGNGVPVDGRDLQAAMDAFEGRTPQRRAAAQHGMQYQMEPGKQPRSDSRRIAGGVSAWAQLHRLRPHRNTPFRWSPQECVSPMGRCGRWKIFLFSDTVTDKQHKYIRERPSRSARPGGAGQCVR
jgi:hypothetical protein